MKLFLDILAAVISVLFGVIIFFAFLAFVTDFFSSWINVLVPIGIIAAVFLLQWAISRTVENITNRRKR